MNESLLSNSELKSVSDLIILNSIQNRMVDRYYFERASARFYKIRRIRPGMQTYFLSGSTAEFHITPSTTNPCDDLDFMMCNTDEICADEDDLTSLTNDLRCFHRNIRCFKKTEHCKFCPGYCELLLIGEINYDWKHEKYNFLPRNNPVRHAAYRCRHTNKNSCQYKPAESETTCPDLEMGSRESKKSGIMSNHLKLAKNIGPARHYEYAFYGDKINLVVETIKCIWCPKWPSEAAEWPLRRRHNEWPTTEIIQNIVKNGCHLVEVSKRGCPENEFQFRLSYSHAEITLLRSWTQIQQTVYHIFRYFAKRKLIKKNCRQEEEVLTGYHIKTTMLWMCEDRSSEWWNSENIVILLSELLCQLSMMLKNIYIPSYFMPQVNLLQANLREDNVIVNVRIIDKYSQVDRLTTWLLKNYVASNLRESLLCLMDTTKVKGQLLKSIFENNNTKFETTFLNYIGDCLDEVLLFSGKGLFGKYKQIDQREILRTLPIAVSPDVILKAIDRGSSSKFLPLTSTILILFIEYLLSCEGLTCDNELVVDLIRGIPMEFKNLVLRSHSFPETYRSKLKQSHVLLLRSQEVMETMTPLTRELEFQILSQTALAILKQCLESHDAGSESVRCAALVYMGALYYAEQKYHTTVNLCSMALTRFEERKSFSDATFGYRKTLSAFCLLFFDDVARITGFVLLLKQTLDPLFCKNRHAHLFLRITPEVFAEYLIAGATGKLPYYSRFVRQLSTLKWNVFDVSFMIFTRLVHTPVLLCKNKTSLNVRSCVYLRSYDSHATKFNNHLPGDTELRNLLFEWCLDMMQLFSTDIFNRYSIKYDPIDCYRALYFYKCGRYKEVTKLCHRILLQPDCSNVKFKILNSVIILPPFDGIFDTDIQTLLGLQTLCFSCLSLEVNRSYRLSYEKLHLRHCTAKRIQCGFALSYLDCKTQYVVYCLRRHFVARYLLLKTAISFGKPRACIYAAFRRIDSRLHFEIVVHKYLYEKFIKKQRPQ